jgi:sec-independent protein translocase protein TatB
MFGMGFSELLIIAVIAILFLGPDKLPSTMVEIAKFFRSVKNTVGSVKQSIEEEMHVADIKQEALAYKQELLNAGSQIEKVANVESNINSSIDSLLHDDEPETTKPQKKVKKSSANTQEVTFKKKKKIKEEDTTDV